MVVIKISRSADSGAPPIRSKAPAGRLVPVTSTGAGLWTRCCAPQGLRCQRAHRRAGTIACLGHFVSTCCLYTIDGPPTTLRTLGSQGSYGCLASSAFGNPPHFGRLDSVLRLFLDAADQVVDGPVADRFAVSPVEEFTHVADDLFSFLVFRLRRG